MSLMAVFQKGLAKALMGKARKNPCKKCGNPHHFTKEHGYLD